MKKVLTKKELARRASVLAGTTMKLALEVIESTLEAIASHLESGGDMVCLLGFGKIKIQPRKRFETMNPHTGDRVIIPAKLGIVLRPSPELTARINEKRPRNGN